MEKEVSALELLKQVNEALKVNKSKQTQKTRYKKRQPTKAQASRETPRGWATKITDPDQLHIVSNNMEGGRGLVEGGGKMAEIWELMGKEKIDAFIAQDTRMLPEEAKQEAWARQTPVVCKIFAKRNAIALNP